MLQAKLFIIGNQEFMQTDARVEGSNPFKAKTLARYAARAYFGSGVTTPYASSADIRFFSRHKSFRHTDDRPLPFV